MAIVSDVEIRLRADIARLQQDLNSARRSVSNAANDIKKTLMSMAAGFSLAALAQQAIAVQRQFDKLNSSLITATGSSRAAGEAFAVLQDFAAKTPFGLQEVTTAFLKLRNLGLTPSERALRSYGDTASGMGKDLNQLIEAVADAATGEFERLKEFGVKAKQQGDQVSLTFQGTTTKVGNNAAEIEEYLMRIGEVQFAGGMARQAATLDGALSALGDQWDQTLMAFNQSGFGDAVHGSVLALSGALQDLAAMFKAVSGAADEEGKKVEEIGPLHKGLTTFFETIMVLGVNVSYVFKTIGRDIGAFAAQAVALFNGGMSGLLDGSTLKTVQGIGKARVADAQREREEVDATTAKILGAAEAARASRAKEAAEREKDTTDRLAKYKIVSNGVKEVSDTEKKAAEQRAKDAAKLAKAYEDFSKSVDARVAETAREAAGLAPLNEAQKLEIDLKEKIADRTLKLSVAQEASLRTRIAEVEANLASIESQKAYKKMQEESGELEKEMTQARLSSLDAARGQVKANEELVATFGMSEAAIARLEVARLREQLAQRSSVGMTLDEIEHLEQLIALKERSASAVTARESMESVKTFWGDVDKTAHDTFVSILDGGKDLGQRLKDTLKNTFFEWLYQQTLKKWIINIQTSTSGGAGGITSLLGGEGGGSGIGSWISAGKKIYEGFTSGMAGTFGNWASTAGKMFGSSALSSFGSGMSAGVAGSGEAAMYASAQTSGNLSAGASAGMGMAKAIPIVGWIAAGMALSNDLYKKGWDAQNGSMSDSKSFGMKLANIFNSPMLHLNKILQKLGMSDKLANMFSGAATVSRLFGRKNPEITAQGLQGTIGAGGFTGNAWADILEKGGVFRSDKEYTKTAGISTEQDTFLDKTMARMVSTVKEFGAVLGAQAQSVDGYSKQIKLTLTDDEEKNKKLIEETFGGVADDLAALMLPTIAKFTQDGETAAAALQRVAGNFVAVTAIMDSLGIRVDHALGAVGVASIEARERLVKLAGGIENLASQTGFFAENFLTQAEQLAPIQRQVLHQLSALGYGSVETADQFKVAVLDLANSGALATEAGAKTYAGLLALAPGFKAITDAAREAQRAMIDSMLEQTARTVDAQKNLIMDSHDAAMVQLEKHIDGINATIERTGTLSAALRGALGTVNSDSQQAGMRAAAQAQITTVLAIAKASGILPTADSMRDALAALQQDAGGQFGSLAEYQREVARTNNELIQLGVMSDEQLGTAERQLRTMQEQMTAAKAAADMELLRLDGLLATAQAHAASSAAANVTLAQMADTLVRMQAGGGAMAAPAPNLAWELQRQQAAGGSIPMPNYTAPSVTMNSDAAMLTALQNMEARMANVENNTMRAAQATSQLAQEFNQVSAGGNALATEVLK